MKKFLNYFYYFLVFSFIGYIWEVFYIFIKTNKIVNAGTTMGPWLPIYGSVGILVYILYKHLKTNVFVLYLVSVLSSAIIEYCTSLYLELVYHMSWWSYSNKPLNLHGRIYLGGVLFFGLLALFCIKVAMPVLEKLYDMMDNKALNIALLILFVIFAFDFIYCSFHPNTMDAKKLNYNYQHIDFYRA